MKSFTELITNPLLIEGLAKDGITVPTTVQSDTLLLALENQDLIVESITGSGKTLAYLLPAFERIDVTSKDLHTIVIAPTHELVIQINNTIKSLSENSGITVKSTTIIGDVNIKRQVETLKSKPHIIVGTPGRILELIQLKKIKAHSVKTIVLDEADKLLTDYNIETVKAIIKTTLRDRQILCYSASISDQAIERAEALMKTPKRFKLNEERINSDIEHICIVVDQRDKMDTLRKVLHAVKPTKAILFINKNEMVQEVVSKLNFHKIGAVGIFGNATKEDRKRALESFRTGKTNILVASDLLARGLDVKEITHVISLDLPVTLSDYTHRVGRTGRAGQKGVAISIVTAHEVKYLLKLEKQNNIVFSLKELYDGNLIDYVLS
ncbi:MAG: DEAD/DEAH box helicase [Bacillota bacterium]|nr:DEAD/DEAH box helicase [Bacillota bacterium]